MSMERIKKLAGTAATLISEDEAVDVLESIERTLDRPLKDSEGSFLVAAIEGRKKYLDKKAGAAQPKFEAGMYGYTKPAAPYADNDEE